MGSKYNCDSTVIINIKQGQDTKRKPNKYVNMSHFYLLSTEYMQVGLNNVTFQVEGQKGNQYRCTQEEHDSCCELSVFVYKQLVYI